MERWKKLEEPPREPDQTPVEIDAGKNQPESMEAMMMRLIQERTSREAVHNGFDSFEESQDFEDEDPNLLDFSKYELEELPEIPEEPLQSPAKHASPTTQEEQQDQGEATPGSADRARAHSPQDTGDADSVGE